MRYWTFVQPKDETDQPEYITMSEKEILQEYYPYWYRKMCDKYGQSFVDATYSFEDCLNDWVTVHWAWESKE